MFKQYLFIIWMICFLKAYAQNNAIFNGGNADGFSVSCVGTAAEAPLPIELLSFTGKCENERTILKWTTASETNNDYFIVEKSQEGMNFKQFTIIDGAGKSSKKLSYSSVDNEPYFGTSYYRLKQTDFDGKHTYSQIVSLTCGNDVSANFSVYPNPINNAAANLPLTLSGLQKDSSVLLVLLDILGKKYYSKMVLTDSYGSVKVAIESSTPLTKGIYIIRAAGDNKLFSKKLVVE